MKRTEKTRSEQFTSASTRESDAPSWLKERVYAPKKQRTLDLVQRSIQSLLKEHQRISLTSIAAISKTIDPTGQGVSESAILNNEEARALYEQHRTWKSSLRRATNITKKVKAPRISTKADRDQQQVRQRYLRMRKAELVDRLLAVEAAYAEQEQRWLSQQDEIFTWRLRAEVAEARLSTFSQSSQTDQ